MNRCDVSVIIVNYLKSKDILDSIEILTTPLSGVSVEVLILDNSCDVVEAERLRSVSHLIDTLIISESNTGYSKAVNKLGRIARGDYLFLMSPDINVVETEFFQKILDFARSHNYPVVSPGQINRDGSRPAICRRFPSPLTLIANRLRALGVWKSNQTSSKYLYEETSLQVDTPIDWIQSSSLLVERRLWEQIGGLDERYFIFMADVELGQALRKQGFSMHLCADIEVIADGKRASEISLSGAFNDILRKGALYWHLKDAMHYFLYRCKM